MGHRAHQAEVRQGGAAEGEGRPLRVVLLTLGTLHLLPDEAVQVLRHRYLLLVYLAVLPVLILADTNSHTQGLAVEVRGPVYMAALAGAVLTIAFAGQFAFWRGWKRLSLTSVLGIATLVGLGMSEAVSHLLLDADNRSLVELVLVVGFYWVTAELVASFVLHKVVPHVLAELRGMPIRRLAETDPAFWQAAGGMAAGMAGPEGTGPSEGAEGSAPAEGGFLVAAERRFAFAALLHLQAYGNYVMLHSRTGQELVTGPLARLVAQIPAGYGRQVHRSHWVAAAALRGWTAKGRDVTLLLDGAASVPVAVTRRREVRDWLAGLGIRQGKPT